MKLDEQGAWYEAWHAAGKHDLPVEQMKQAQRLSSLNECLSAIQAEQSLVVGCGSGDEMRLVNATMLTALDLSYVAVNKARQKASHGHYLQADGMRLPFPDMSFDLVLTSEVIEHIPQPDEMLRDIWRVLKPDGTVIISTPNWFSFFGLARKVGEIVLQRSITSDNQPIDRWSTPQSLNQLLAATGFQTIHQRGAWYFPPTGLGHNRLPDDVMAQIFGGLLSSERWLQQALPGWGHLLIVVAQKQASS